MVRAYKSVLKEKEALEASLKALSLTQSPQKHLTPRRPRSRGLDHSQLKEGSLERSGESDAGLRSESDTDATGAQSDADRHSAEVAQTPCCDSSSTECMCVCTHVYMNGSLTDWIVLVGAVFNS